MVVKDKVYVGVSGGEFGVRAWMAAYSTKDGSQVWRAYSEGPDNEILVDQQKTTALGKPVGADSSIKSWQGDQWKIGGGGTWGWRGFSTLRCRCLDLFLRNGRIRDQDLTEILGWLRRWRLH